MPRGAQSDVGTTMVNANGYHNTKTENGWRLTHHIVAEQVLGRPLEPNEMARFKDGDRTNLDPGNIEVIKKGKVSIRKRLARIDSQLEQLQAERAILIQELRSLG